MAEDIGNLGFDPYELLEVEPDVEEKELLKAYRKKALKWHPDKNPDNKDAAEKMFHKLSKALEILSDAAARAAYDKLRRAHAAARERRRHVDSKRRKLREELESRESGAGQQKKEEEDAAQSLQQEIERLRREGSKLLRKAQEDVERTVHQNSPPKPPPPPPGASAGGGSTSNKTHADDNHLPPVRLKLSWKAVKGDPQNGGYSEQILRNMFEKYGDISILLLSGKKRGSALLEFVLEDSAQLAFNEEKGLPDNPLEITVIGEFKPPKAPFTSSTAKSEEQGPEVTVLGGFDGGLATDSDFESLVLTKMRQAEERKRLIAEMEKEEAQDT